MANVSQCLGCGDDIYFDDHYRICSVCGHRFCSQKCVDAVRAGFFKDVATTGSAKWVRQPDATEANRSQEIWFVCLECAAGGTANAAPQPSNTDELIRAATLLVEAGYIVSRADSQNVKKWNHAYSMQFPDRGCNLYKHAEDAARTFFGDHVLPDIEY